MMVDDTEQTLKWLAPWEGRTAEGELNPSWLDSPQPLVLSLPKRIPLDSLQLDFFPAYPSGETPIRKAFLHRVNLTCYTLHAPT